MKILLKGGFDETIFTLCNMRDNCNYFLYLFKKTLNKKGYHISTIEKKGYDNILYWNYIKDYTNEKKYLIVREPPCIIPDNHKTSNYKEFDKIFTWDDNNVNNVNIFKLNFVQTPPEKEINNTGEKFCCIISGNKFSFHKNELYSERKNAISFFEKNYPEDFDLYGARWNKFFYPFKTNIKSLFQKQFSFFKVIQYLYIIIFDNNHKSYKGVVDNKLITLSNYTFSICYENQKGLNGYITEKIWDCFFAGCIPIYLGCKNINKYIPKNCYIDKRKYKSYEELYIYLKSLSEEDIKNYKNNIREFIKSSNAKKFYSEEWIKTILKNIK